MPESRLTPPICEFLLQTGGVFESSISKQVPSAELQDAFHSGAVQRIYITIEGRSIPIVSLPKPSTDSISIWHLKLMQSALARYVYDKLRTNNPNVIWLKEHHGIAYLHNDHTVVRLVRLGVINLDLLEEFRYLQLPLLLSECVWYNSRRRDVIHTDSCDLPFITGMQIRTFDLFKFIIRANVFDANSNDSVK